MASVNEIYQMVKYDCETSINEAKAQGMESIASRLEKMLRGLKDIAEKEREN